MRRFTNVICFIVIAAALNSCHSKYDPIISKTIFSLAIDGSFETDQTEDWIVLHDSLGKVIDWKAFESGDAISFENASANLKGSLTVTHIQHSGLGNNAESWFNVPIGDEWIFRQSSQAATHDSPDGTFNVTASYTTPVENMSVSNKFSISASATINANSASCQTPYSPDAPDYILSVRSGDGSVKYKKLSEVTSGSSFSVFDSDLLSFDQTATLAFPSCSDIILIVTQREGDQTFDDGGYLTDYHINKATHNFLTTGYLNALSKPITNLILSYPAFQYHYTNTGGIPGPFSWPASLDFSVSDRTISTFGVNAGSFLYVDGFWDFSNIATGSYIRWNTHGSKSQQKISELPAEILADVPDLIPSNMQFSGATFYTKGLSYAEFISRLHKSGGAATPLESISITVF